MPIIIDWSGEGKKHLSRAIIMLLFMLLIGFGLINFDAFSSGLYGHGGAGWRTYVALVFFFILALGNFLREIYCFFKKA